MKYLSVLFSVMLLLALGGQPMFAQSGEDLFQQALQKERSQGDPEGAISLYQKIVDNVSDISRAIKARALVQIGKNYEKLGVHLVGEARLSYEQVVRDYTDQPEMVAEARSRLEALETAVAAAAGPDEPKALTIRKVVSEGFNGMPSPDGRYFSYVHWGYGNLAVYDMKTGERRNLTDDAGKRFADASIWSPDSKQIANAWFTWEKEEQPWEGFDLRIVNVDGGESRIFKDAPYPVAWSRDGKYIVGFRDDNQESLILFEIETGLNRTIKNSPKGALDLTHPSLSADGKHLLYGTYENGEGTPRNIHLLSTDGRIDQPLIDHSADDHRPHWTPDGRGVVFLSDRSGTSGLWYVPVAEEKIAGEPRLIRPGLGTGEDFDTYGFTDDGTFYYKEVNPTANVFVAELNVGGGASQALQTPELVSERFDGTNKFPFWSPDGSKLAYFSQRRQGYYVLVIRDVQSGEERDIKLNFDRMRTGGRYPSPQWSPDGKTILVLGKDAVDKERGWGHYLIDLETERATRIIDGRMGSTIFTPDGEDILFVRPFLSIPGEIVQRNLASGAERVLSEVQSEKLERQYIQSHAYLNISPDGSQLAYFKAGESIETCTIEVMSLKDGSTKTLWWMTKEAIISWAVRLHWMPDGEHLLMATYPQDDIEQQQLYLLDVTSGELKPIGTPLIGDDQIFFVDVHPNGTTIAFYRGIPIDYPGPRGSGDIWALENLVFDQ